jgi:hypothetical protein
MHVGLNSVALNIARILWAFDIKPAKTPSGHDIEVDMYVIPRGFPQAFADKVCSFAFTDGFNSVPQPFQCSIKRRSSIQAKAIEQGYENALIELKAYAPSKR